MGMLAEIAELEGAQIGLNMLESCGVGIGKTSELTEVSFQIFIETER